MKLTSQDKGQQGRHPPSQDSLLNALIDSIDDQVVVIALDHRIVLANAAASKQWGWPAQNLVGRRCHEIFHLSDIPCAISGEQCPIEEVLSSERPVRQVHIHDLTAEDPIHLEIVSSPIRDGAGKITHMIQVMRDVTERIRLSKDLQLRNDELSVLNAFASAVSQSLNLDEVLNRALEKILEVNDVFGGGIFILNEEHAELELRAYRGIDEEFVRQVARVEVGTEISGRVAATGEPIIVEDVKSDPRVSKFIVGGSTLRHLASIPIKSKGKVLGVLNVGRSTERGFSSGEIRLFTAMGSQLGVAVENARLLTDLTAAYEEQKALDQLKNDFISMASHEFRTPLTIIKGFTYMLRKTKGMPNAARQAEWLGEIDAQVGHLTELIEDTLNVARIESGRLDLDIRPIDLVAAVHKITENVAFEAEERRIEVNVSTADESLYVQADPIRTEQILLNLLTNAINYSSDGGVVKVGVSANDHMAQVSVKDQGVGIEEQHMNRLFHKFSRLPNIRQRAVKGTGLGLYISKGLVESQGGTIWAESRPGCGSTFYFTLPIAKNAV